MSQTHGSFGTQSCSCFTKAAETIRTCSYFSTGHSSQRRCHSQSTETLPLTFKLLSVIAVLITVYYYWFEQLYGGIFDLTKQEELFYKMHVAVISSTYFKNPIANYTANTMVTLFNSDDRITRPFELYCSSSNSTHNVSEPAQVIRLVPGIKICKWTQYIAICNVTQRLSTFAINDKSLSFDLKPVEIPFRSTVARRIGVVACLSPLFYFERWQSLIISLEVYRQFGVDLQVYYVQSILTKIIALLKIYEKRNVVLIEPWTLLDVDDVELGYDPNMELDMRNQAAAHTDCMLKFKAAAEFIIVGDYDDVLFPRFGRTYRDEFRLFLTLVPNAAALQYQRYNANFSTSWNPEGYSLAKFLETTRLTSSTVGAKSVIIPSRVQTVRPHEPGDIHEGYQMAKIVKQLNVMIHFRKWRAVDRGYGYRKGRTQPHDLFTIRDFTHIGGAVKVGKRFQGFLDASNGTYIFNELPNSTMYFTPMYECYAQLVFTSVGIHTCAGPVMCDIPPVTGLGCTVAKRIFDHASIGENLFVHYSEKQAQFIERNNGCSM